jgi:uncharacterized membrane protein
MPSPPNTDINRLVQRNISALLARRKAEEADLSWQERAAERITRFAGSMPFVWLHAFMFGSWVAINLGVIPGVAPFDPTFVVLAMVASVEAIFLSTFILITQNRMQAQADRRADLNLQISLLAEHEITRLVEMTAEIGRRMDIASAKKPELEELKRDVRPEGVLETLDQAEKPSDVREEQGFPRKEGD